MRAILHRTASGYELEYCGEYGEKMLAELGTKRAPLPSGKFPLSMQWNEVCTLIDEIRMAKNLPRFDSVLMGDSLSAIGFESV